MTRKTLVLVGAILSVLLGLGLTGTHAGHAHVSFDCETDRFAAFMNADAQYTSTFRSWYFNDPMDCSTECTNQCNQLSTQAARNACMANLSQCVSDCGPSRYNAFLYAQDSLMWAANQPCSYNPDACDTARGRRDQCVATRYAHMQNPVLDENGQIDATWYDFVINEYMACWSASGIDSCQ